MLENLMKLYVMAMAYDVRSPLPHLVGPPGCGKSTTVEQLAKMVGVNLHIINLARLSPLELEGVQMPHTEKDEAMKLKLLHATFWTQIKEGDIVLFDELLRAFPETFNGLLDILTSRKVSDLVLPKAFFLGASNSTVSYDKALEDRLLHLPVPDPRKRKGEKKKLAQMIVDTLGLLPEMTDSYEMQSLLDTEVLPMFDILDQFKKGATASPQQLRGTSIRKLIGQAQLRQIESPELADLLVNNNNKAMREAKFQFVFLTDGKSAPGGWEEKAKQILDRAKDKLTPIQLTNIQLNLELIELERIRSEKEEPDDGPDDVFDDVPF